MTELTPEEREMQRQSNWTDFAKAALNRKPRNKETAGYTPTTEAMFRQAGYRKAAVKPVDTLTSTTKSLLGLNGDDEPKPKRRKGKRDGSQKR
jgi:hypothetical protein